ncbi:expressed unknown protein [Seminavis robusta]|uniref:Uncharacterized protein n=1 Tax=Seminavis robusta TaxID=568900 RepID=A0A9N8DUZ5_9STRA|nr:expressed unknown protein [Seminavis robusta]|eukprot:Sro378_g130371.1  (140) ;mRNA; f:70719-71138
MKFSSSIIKLLSWSWTTYNNNSSNTMKTPVLQVAKEMMGNNDNKDVPAAEEVPTFQLDELDKTLVETAALLHTDETNPDVEFQQHGRFLGAYCWGFAIRDSTCTSVLEFDASRKSQGTHFFSSISIASKLESLEQLTYY